MKDFIDRFLGCLAMSAICTATSLGNAANFKQIPNAQSKIDVKITGLDRTKLRHYYVRPKGNNQYKVNRYVAFFQNRNTGQYLQASVDVVVNSEFYWEHVADTTVNSIKRLKYFKNKSIKITGISSGMNAGYDSAAGDPNYLIFTADGLNCGRMRRISAFGPHGGTTEPYLISGFYCAPRGESFTSEQAARVAKNGFIYRALEDSLGNDLYPPPKL